MDVLSDIFETIRLRGSLYFRTDFSPPWGTTVPSLGRAARFHHVVHGHCFIAVGKDEPVRLAPGDFVVVPGGASHILSDTPKRDAPPLERVLELAGYDGQRLITVRGGDSAAPTQLICGHFTFADGSDHPLLRALPSLIRIPLEARRKRPWFDEVLRLLVSHVFSEHDGSEAIVSRLSEIVFIEAIRSAGEEAPELHQLIQGFADPRIGRAILLIHREPARQWTVEELAQEAGMSRTRFAHSFHEAFGTGPISYLAEWRLQRALRQLRVSRRAIADIAYANGYASPAAFSRAFSDRFGASPRAWRAQEEMAAA